MTNSKIAKYALFHALGAAAYIVLVATFMFNAEKLFGQEDKFLTPVAFLLLFVFSAATMGMLVFGRPIMWYLDGLKKEALKFIFYTLGFLFVETLIALLLLLIA